MRPSVVGARGKILEYVFVACCLFVISVHLPTDRPTLLIINARIVATICTATTAQHFQSLVKSTDRPSARPFDPFCDCYFLGFFSSFLSFGHFIRSSRAEWERCLAQRKVASSSLINSRSRRVWRGGRVTKATAVSALTTQENKWKSKASLVQQILKPQRKLKWEKKKKTAMPRHGRLPWGIHHLAGSSSRRKAIVI